MKGSSLRKASLSATDFQLSQFPCKNKALADENADLRAKVAQLLDEKEKWQIKYYNLNMKHSDFVKYRKDVKYLLQRMSFYLQNFLVVRDMLVHMSQQESHYEEMENHNTKAKQQAEPEQMLKDQGNHLMREDEQQHKQQQQKLKKQQQQQQQQQHIPQSHLQNTSINPVLQLSSMHNQMQKCVSENDGEHHIKDMTGLQKSRLSNKVQEQAICVNLSTGNDRLKHGSSFQKKFYSKGEHKQLLKQNDSLLQECCSLDCECFILEGQQQHVQCHLQNTTRDENLKLNLSEGQLLRLQQNASQNCYLSQQPLIEGQQGSISGHFDQENDFQAQKQRTVHKKELEAQVFEEQKLDHKSQQSLEFDSKAQYCEGDQQQHHVSLQGKLQTERELFNTVIQNQKPYTSQRPSCSDVQGQITTDKAQQFEADQCVQFTLNQGIKLMVGKGQSLRNKELQLTHDVDHLLLSDREQQIPKENRYKALQTVQEEEEEGEKEEEEKRKSVKLGENLASAKDKLHAIRRDQDLAENPEIYVGINKQHPVKLCHLLPASLLATLSFVESQKQYRDKGELQSSESKLQLSPEGKELPMGQMQKHTVCGEQNIVKQLGEEQGQEHNIEGQQLTSIEVQQQKTYPPYAYIKGLQQPIVKQNQQLVTVQDRHSPDYQLNGEQKQQSPKVKEPCLSPVQIVLGKEQPQCTKKREHLTIEQDLPLTAHQEHQSRTGNEHGMMNNQELCTITDLQHHFANVQQQCSLPCNLQQGVGNKRKKLTNNQINHFASVNVINLKSKHKKQFDKENGVVTNTEQTRQFPAKNGQKIIKKTSELIPRNEQKLSCGQPTVKQVQQQQQFLKEDQQLKGEQAHQRKEQRTQQLVVEEVKGIDDSFCLSVSWVSKQSAAEEAQHMLSETVQQQFTNSILELSAELSQEILMQKFQGIVTKEAKQLPSEHHQWLVTKKEWNLKGLQGQSTPPLCVKERLEHSSLFLLSELSNTGLESSFNSSTHSILHLAKKTQQTSTVNTTAFETSCNSSTQSVLRCAKKILQKSTLNTTALHRSYMEDSIIKRIPTITEAPIYETLENYKVSHPASPKKLYNRNGRPRRKCTIGVNYFLSP